MFTDPDESSTEDGVMQTTNRLARGVRELGTARLPEFREAIAEHVTASRGVEVSPERVLVGTGAKPFLFFGVLATRSARRRDRPTAAQRAFATAACAFR